MSSRPLGEAGRNGNFVARILRDAALILGKDLLLEWRTRTRLNALIFFSFATLLMFSFALGPDTKLLEQNAGGYFWLAILFSSVLALGESFRVERENASLDFLLSKGFERGIRFRASPTPAGRRTGHVDSHLALLGLAGQLQLHSSVGRSSLATCQPAILSERVEADGRFCEPAPGADLRFNDHGLDSVFLQ